VVSIEQIWGFIFKFGLFMAGIALAERLFKKKQEQKNKVKHGS